LMEIPQLLLFGAALELSPLVHESPPSPESLLPPGVFVRERALVCVFLPAFPRASATSRCICAAASACSDLSAVCKKSFTASASWNLQSARYRLNCFLLARLCWRRFASELHFSASSPSSRSCARSRLVLVARRLAVASAHGRLELGRPLIGVVAHLGLQSAPAVALPERPREREAPAVLRQLRNQGAVTTRRAPEAAQGAARIRRAKRRSPPGGHQADPKRQPRASAPPRLRDQSAHPPPRRSGLRRAPISGIHEDRQHAGERRASPADRIPHVHRRPGGPRLRGEIGRAHV
jgi:hypothetical protein